MAENVIHVRATRADIKQAIARIPSESRDDNSITHAMMVRVGMTALGRIKQAFVVKSRGGTDEAGDRWKPLSPKTIAYSKTRQRGRGGRTRAENKRESHPSQALTKRQRDRWWEVYRRQLAIRKGDKGHAAAVSWLVLKREGAQTLLTKYGYRQVEILRDTGLLLNSLSPGVASAEQVFRVGAGEVIVGTNRKGAAAHHHGVPGRLPQRRLWPETSKWPASWWRDIVDQVKQGLVDITISLIKERDG